MHTLFLSQPPMFLAPCQSDNAVDSFVPHLPMARLRFFSCLSIRHDLSLYF